jgi:acetyl esterase/lipase
VALGAVAQRQEAQDLGSWQCGFESHRPHDRDPALIEDAVNLKIMKLAPGFRYSSAAAPILPGTDQGERLTIDVVQQISRRQTGVTLRRGVTYSAGLRLELHTPAVAGRYPLVVYLPGGGFVVAARRMARRERAFIAAGGFVVASAEYRTTRQRATYTDGLADVQAAIDQLAGHSGEYGIDPDRIALWGESAGGYLASLAGLADPRIRAVVDQFGASDLARLADGFDARMAAALANPRHPIRRYRATDANPVDLVRPGAPAFLLLHGDDDRIIPPAQTLMLHRALLAAGADSTYYLLTGAGHGHLALSRQQARQWSSLQLMTIIREFLDRQLRS